MFNRPRVVIQAKSEKGESLLDEGESVRPRGPGATLEDHRSWLVGHVSPSCVRSSDDKRNREIEGRNLKERRGERVQGGGRQDEGRR
jgi:hypothetical protein